MKKILLTLIMLGMVLLLTVPASAARPERVGDQINIFVSGSQFFPEGQSFHITHGWDIDPSAGYPIRLFSFVLEVSGVANPSREADFVDREYLRGSEEPLRRLWVHNSPDGLTGVHSFTGRWFAPCGYLVEYLNYPPGDCPDRFEVVEEKTSLVEVTFYAP